MNYRFPDWCYLRGGINSAMSEKKTTLEGDPGGIWKLLWKSRWVEISGVPYQCGGEHPFKPFKHHIVVLFKQQWVLPMVFLGSQYRNMMAGEVVRTSETPGQARPFLDSFLKLVEAPARGIDTCPIHIGADVWC